MTQRQAGRGAAERVAVERATAERDRAWPCGAERGAIGLGRGALCVTLCALLCAEVCAAGQFNASDETRSSVRIEAPRTAAAQIEAPIDATMARLARLENVAGFDPGRLSA